MPTKTYRTKMHDRIDRICYDRYGNTTNRIVEWVLSQNPGIEQHAIVLPPGIIVILPEPPIAVTQAPMIKQIFLWD
jgi:phage tail protein X